MSRREASPTRNSASSANIARINETTGDYLGNDRFDLNEDFWTRDYLKPEIQARPRSRKGTPELVASAVLEAIG